MLTKELVLNLWHCTRHSTWCYRRYFPRLNIIVVSVNIHTGNKVQDRLRVLNIGLKKKKEKSMSEINVSNFRNSCRHATAIPSSINHHSGGKTTVFSHKMVTLLQHSCHLLENLEGMCRILLACRDLQVPVNVLFCNLALWGGCFRRSSLFTDS